MKSDFGDNLFSILICLDSSNVEGRSYNSLLKWEHLLALHTKMKRYNIFSKISANVGAFLSVYQLIFVETVQLPVDGRTREEKQTLRQYRSKAEFYICACLNMNNSTNVKRTPAGLLYTRRWNNMQYVSNGMLLLTAYSDHLRSTNQTINCHAGSVGPHEILLFVKSQVDYILGENPMRLSYLVGFGPTYPNRVHHRGASTVSYSDSKVFVGCMQGYHSWLGRQAPNPNVLFGALVGGPDMKDKFRDRRTNYAQTEACTYNTAPLVGLFAKLNALEKGNSSPTFADEPLISSA